LSQYGRRAGHRTEDRCCCCCYSIQYGCKTIAGSWGVGQLLECYTSHLRVLPALSSEHPRWRDQSRTMETSWRMPAVDKAWPHADSSNGASGHSETCRILYRWAWNRDYKFSTSGCVPLPVTRIHPEEEAFLCNVLDAHDIEVQILLGEDDLSNKCSCKDVELPP
jgi:hypothetical protein